MQTKTDHNRRQQKLDHRKRKKKKLAKEKKLQSLKTPTTDRERGPQPTPNTHREDDFPTTVGLLSTP